MKNFIIGEYGEIEELLEETLAAFKHHGLVSAYKEDCEAMYYEFCHKRYTGNSASLMEFVEDHYRDYVVGAEDTESIIEVEEKEPVEIEKKQCNDGMFVTEGKGENLKAIILFHRVTLVVGHKVYIEELGNENCVMLSDKDLNLFWVKF